MGRGWMWWSRAFVAAAVLATAAGSLAPVDVAVAHVPVLEPDRSSNTAATATDRFPGALAIPDPGAKSLAVYGYLKAADVFDAYRFTPARNGVVSMSILVPASTAPADFRPSFAAVTDVRASAPGGNPSVDVPAWLEGRIGPVGTGAQVIVAVDPGASPRPTFFEPFSVERYFEGGDVEVPVRRGVPCYIVVYAPADALDTSGPYVLGLGSVEAFSAGDWLRTPLAVARIKVGLYGGGPFLWTGLGQVLALPVIVAGVVALVVWRRRVRAKRV